MSLISSFPVVKILKVSVLVCNIAGADDRRVPGDGVLRPGRGGRRGEEEGQQAEQGDREADTEG